MIANSYDSCNLIRSSKVVVISQDGNRHYHPIIVGAGNDNCQQQQPLLLVPLTMHVKHPAW